MRSRARFGCMCSDKKGRHDHYFLGDKEVSKKQYDKASPKKDPTAPGNGALLESTRPACYPCVGEVALETLAHCKEAFEQESVRVGVPTEYVTIKPGIVGPKFTDKAHQNAFLKAKGLRNQGAGYLDYSGEN